MIDRIGTRYPRVVYIPEISRARYQAMVIVGGSEPLGIHVSLMYNLQRIGEEDWKCMLT
jgi:hypothetical protein